MAKGPRIAKLEVHQNGEFPVPQGPGLGVEYDWDLIAKWRTGLVEYT